VVAKLFLATVVIVGLIMGGAYAYHHLYHDRSVRAYCKTFYSKGKQFRLEYSITSSNDPLRSLANMMSAPQQLANFFGQLDSVAPMTIEPAVATIQKAFQSQMNQLESGNLFTMLFGGLIDRGVSQNAVNEVNQYTLQNCGSPPSI